MGRTRSVLLRPGLLFASNCLMSRTPAMAAAGAAFFTQFRMPGLLPNLWTLRHGMFYRH